MNMKIMKRPFCLLCAAAMMLGLVACNSGKSSDSSSSLNSSIQSADSDIISDVSSGNSVNSEESSAAATSSAVASNETSSSSVTPSKATNLTRDQVMAKMPAKLKNTTIKYVSWDDPRVAMEKDAIKEFEQKTGIKLEVEIMGLGTIPDTVAARIAAGNSPDLVRCDEAYPFVCKNFQPITNLGYDFNDNAWDKDLMSYYTYNGLTYSMQLKDTPFTPVALFFYNKKALSRAEMEDMDPYTIWKNNPADWTWDKFWSICDTFLKRNNNKDGYYGAVFSGTYLYAYLRCFGLTNMDYNPAKGKFETMLQNPEFVKRTEILADCIQKKYVTQGSAADDFQMGRTLFCWNWMINLQADNTYFAELKKTNSLGVVPIPTDSTKQVLYQHYGHGVPVGAKNGEAVPYFIRYIQDRKSYNVNNMYTVEHAAEVVEWSISRGRANKNFYVGTGIHIYNFTSKILVSPSAQVKSICDTCAPEFEAVATDFNNAIATLPK